MSYKQEDQSFPEHTWPTSCAALRSYGDLMLVLNSWRRAGSREAAAGRHQGTRGINDFSPLQGRAVSRAGARAAPQREPERRGGDGARRCSAPPQGLSARHGRSRASAGRDGTGPGSPGFRNRARGGVSRAAPGARGEERPRPLPPARRRVAPPPPPPLPSPLPSQPAGGRINSPLRIVRTRATFGRALRRGPGPALGRRGPPRRRPR